MQLFPLPPLGFCVDKSRSSPSSAHPVSVTLTVTEQLARCLALPSKSEATTVTS